MDILKPLNWRYATKQFNPNKKINNNQLNILLESINLTPTSLGLQQFKIIIIDDDETKQKLRSVSFDQAQLTDSSHVLVFATQDNIGNKQVDEYIKRISNTRNIKIEDLAEYETLMKNKISRSSNEEIDIWASKQCYIGLGFLLYAAAQLKIDSCPIEGFDPVKVDELLGLKEKNLKSSVIATLGFRSDNDKYQHATKVRVPLDDLIIKH